MESDLPSPAHRKFLAAIADEESELRHQEITRRILHAAAWLVEREADTICTIAETTDPRVKRALNDLAARIRWLNIPQ